MKRWPITRYLFSSHLVFIPLLLVGFYLAAAVLVGVVVAVTNVRISVVDAGAQVLPWFTAGYGATVSGLLATMLVHGRTRREFIVQHPIFQVACTAVLAAITTGAYAIEGVAYRAFDWPQKLQQNRFYESAGDYGTIFVTYWCMYLLWLAVGVTLSIALYRWEAAGALALLPAGALLVLQGGVTGFFSFSFARTDLSLAVVTVVPVAVTWAMLWVAGRDVSLRSRVA